MRTYKLTRDIDIERTYEILLDEVSRYSGENINDSTARRRNAYPKYISISGLFMFDKPVCVRSDLTSQTCEPRIYQTYGEEHNNFICDALRKNIKRWYSEGKGDAIIHMRSYEPANVRPYDRRHSASSPIVQVNRARLESFPYKVPDVPDMYFYHLGRYGSTDMWNNIVLARRGFKSVPKTVHDVIASQLGDTQNMELANQILRNIHMYQDPDEYDDNGECVEYYRTHGLLWWYGGEIVDHIKNVSDTCGYGSRNVNVVSLNEVTNNEE